MGPTGVITEQGDLGLGYTPLNESEQEQVDRSYGGDDKEPTNDNN